MRVHSNRKQPIRLTPWLIAAVLLLAGCTDPERVLAPPKADVEGIQTVAVFAVANETSERDLTDRAEAGLLERLGTVGWYEVVSPGRLAEFMLDRNMDPFDTDMDSPEWNEIARDITLNLDGDGYVLSLISDYTEAVELGSAYMAEGPDGMQWLADQTTVVTVTWRGRLVNAHTGLVVYERTVVGEGHVSDARLLNWAIPESPPANVIPAAHRRDLPAAREAALVDALDKFTRNVLPQPDGEPAAVDGP